MGHEKIFENLSNGVAQISTPAQQDMPDILPAASFDGSSVNEESAIMGNLESLTSNEVFDAEHIPATKDTENFESSLINEAPFNKDIPIDFGVSPPLQQSSIGFSEDGNLGVGETKTGLGVTQETQISQSPLAANSPNPSVIGNETVASAQTSVSTFNDSSSSGQVSITSSSGESEITANDSSNISVSENAHYPISSSDGLGSSYQPHESDMSIPVFSNVEIGGGRITGTETNAANPNGIKFGMYQTDQYMKPSGDYNIVETIDGSKWYKQYAMDTVKKTPFENKEGNIEYKEEITKSIPPVPKRKDKI